MTSRTAAARYARALLDVAVKEQVDLEAVDRDLAAFARLVATNAALNQAMLNPVVPVTRKRAAMAALTERAGTTGIVAKLLVLLAERDRLVLLDEIVGAFRQRVLDYRHVVRAEVTTTAPLGADREKAVERGLATATGRRLAFAARVDPSIIGGVVARVGSTVYDGSVARQLERMRQQLERGQP